MTHHHRFIGIMAAKGWITIHIHTHSKQQSHSHTTKYESMSLVVSERFK